MKALAASAWWMAIIPIALGCLSADAEPTLAEQVIAVRQGPSTTIKIEARPVSDADLTALAGLARLKTLQLDHANNQISAAGLERLATLPELEHLRLRGVVVNPAMLDPVLKLTHLRILNLPQADLDDAAFARLAELPNLEQLRIASPRLTPQGLAALAAFPTLKRLHLIDVPVGDAGLKVFEKLPALESLYIDGGKFSDAALEELFRVRPTLHVHFDQQHHDRDPHRHAH